MKTPGDLLRPVGLGRPPRADEPSPAVAPETHASDAQGVRAVEHEGLVPPEPPQAALLGGTASSAPPGGAAQAPAADHVTRPWQVRLDPTDRASSLTVAQAVLAVMAGLPPTMLLEPVRSAAVQLTQGTRPRSAHDMQEVYARCMRALHPDAVAEALGALALAANDAAHAAARTTVDHREELAPGKADRRDWHRTWGLRLLPDDDVCFRDPAYLVAFNQESKGVRSSSLGGRTTLSDARVRFEEALHAFDPSLRLLAVAESGSDAVSLVGQLAIALGRRRAEGTPFRGTTPQVAFFEGVFGGGRGLGASWNLGGWGRGVSEDKSAWRLHSPTSTELEPTGDELERVLGLEEEALASLRAMLTKTDGEPLGAIFLETIQGANGVRFYRTEFLLAVRKLADEWGVPIVADEVLTGGRTGKLFAWQHHEGFEPDIVVIGKGLQQAALLAVRRTHQAGSQWASDADLGVTTTAGDPTRFLKGAQVLNRIREGDLLAHAADVGAYLCARLREVQRAHGVVEDASGRGLMIGMQRVPGMHLEVSHAWGNARDRLLPPLTLTRADVDELVDELLRRTPADMVAMLERSRDALATELADVLAGRIGGGPSRRELAATADGIRSQLRQVERDLRNASTGKP